MGRVLNRRSSYALVGSVVLLGMGALASNAQAQWRGGHREVARCAPAPAVCDSPRATVVRVDHRYGSRHRESRRYVRECAPVRCAPVYVQRCEPVRYVPRPVYRYPATGISLSAFFRF